MKRYFTAEEVDGWLRTIMANIYEGCATAAAKYGKEGDLMAGANLCATEKIIDAMVGQGVC
jgi:glutamate dehydrogenase (NADP+)